MGAVLDRWRLSALIASAAMLAIAHGFETFGGLAPCELCLRQREVYWAAGALALGSMILVRLPGGGRWRAASDAILCLAFLAGAAVAAYHAGAEWRLWPGPKACSSVAGGVTVQALQALMQGGPARAPACDKAAWVFLGLSMAGWNALISLGLASLSAAAGWKERSSP